MDITNIITNPITIGLLAGLITYIYMKWRNDKYNKNKDKKKKKDINLLIPFSVFIVFWFISYAYFSSLDENTTKENKTEEHPNIIENIIDKKNNDINIKIKKNNDTNPKLSESEPISINLISKTNGVQIPENLPDIFLEMA